MKMHDANYLNTVYKDIGKELGLKNALKIFNMFKGTQIAFPTKFLSPEYLKEAIIHEYDGKNAKKLAAKYNYSERSIRRIVKETCARSD